LILLLALPGVVSYAVCLFSWGSLPFARGHLNDALGEDIVDHHTLRARDFHDALLAFLVAEARLLDVVVKPRVQAGAVDNYILRIDDAKAPGFLARLCFTILEGWIASEFGCLKGSWGGWFRLPVGRLSLDMS
jgi:hypothetical protein